jgi:hypothetical protein
MKRTMATISAVRMMSAALSGAAQAAITNDDTADFSITNGNQIVVEAQRSGNIQPPRT